MRQQTFGRVSHTGWRQMIAWFYTDEHKWPSNSHVSDPDTGSLNGPYTFKALVLDGVPHSATSRGDIYIDEVYALNQPVPVDTPAETQPLATSATTTTTASNSQPSPATTVVATPEGQAIPAVTESSYTGLQIEVNQFT